MPPFRSLLAWILCAAAIAPPATAQTISNTAALSYKASDGDRILLSNTVTLNRTKLPTRLSFRHVPTGFQFRGMACDGASTPTFTAAPLSPDELASAAPLVSLDTGDPVVFVLEAAGENHDPLVRETAHIAVQAGGRANAVLLRETAPDSGVFAGAIPASDSRSEFAACALTLGRQGQITLGFNETEFSHASSASLLIDPEGYVFDSHTGKLIDGATVTLIDDSTGRPATQVYGDDGVSTYPATVVTGTQVTDSRGAVYVLTAGNFRFPLVPAGRYRLRIVPPAGYAAPSKASPEQIAALQGPQSPFLITDASYGGVLVIAGMAAIRTDVPIDPATESGGLVLEKEASVREAEPGDFVQYRLTLRNTAGQSAAGATIDDRLPTGLRYRVGSTRGAAEPAIAADGRSLRFTLPSLSAGASARISYLAEVTPGAPIGEAINRAVAAAPSFRQSNEASASVRLKAPLFTDALTIIGRVSEGNCGDPMRGRKGVAGIRLLMEDGSFVVTDADGRYHFEGVRPGTHIVQIDSSSVPATHEPVTCDRDTRSGRSATSRFVEGGGGSLQRVDFQLRPTGKTATDAARLPIAPLDDARAAGNRADWLAEATPGIGWLFPEVDHNPRAPALRVVIRHAPGQRVALRLNGEPVDPLSFDGSDADEARGVAISRWTGLHLQDRDNRLEARVLDANGAVVTTLDRVVHYANLPVRAEFSAEKSRLVADGLTRPLIAVRVTDRDGRPVRAGTTVPFRVDQPYVAAQETALQQGRQLAGLERTEATARVVGDDGYAFVALEPTRQAGLVRVAIALVDEKVTQTSEIKAWLSAGAEDWVVVGYGKGTIGYDVLSRARRIPGGKRHDTVTDGQLALYAKGRIKGSWLLTLAYDSDRRFDRDRGVLGTIDPDRYYTVYGDGTLQGYDAPTRRKLYLRLERREFYALYGDFETGLVDSRLGRYSRTMNGVKAEYSGRRLSFTAFGAHDDSRYGRDEIQGNGLSGPYRLSVRNIVPNSDKLSLETRDRFRPERIVDSRALSRHIDYDIDSGAGTIRFREPILSRDANLNPVFIVIDYEVEGGMRKLAAGGRGALHLGRAELGATVLRDEGQGRNATLAAIDAKVRLKGNTEIRAEAATGGGAGIDDGRAWLAEVEHHDSRADVLVYARQQDVTYGFGQQNLGEAGTRKLGLDGRLRLTERLHLTGSAWYQQNLDDDGQRVAGEARLEYRRDNGVIFAGAQFATDRGIGTGADRDSRLLTLGANQSLFDNRLELSGQGQLALGGDNDSLDFPTRQQIGAKWRITDAVRLIADHEIAQGRDYTAQTSRIGFDLAPWAGAHLLTTLNQGAIGENGARTFAQYGLSQSLPLGKRWTLDATLDSSSTFEGRTLTEDAINPLHPPAAGGVLGREGLDGDFIAATLGATYRSELWSWNGRLEYRSSDRETRWGVTSNLLRTLGEGSTLASSIQAYRVRDARGSLASSATADLAFALRPLDSRWSLLERFELRHERASAGTLSGNVLAVPSFADGGQTTLRAVNNLAVNYRTGDEGWGHGFEASVYYGAKYVRGRYGDETIDGFIDVTGIEVRKDIGTRFDLGANVSVQHGWTSRTAAFSVGPSVGVSPARDLWLTAGYNVSGYRDHDFEEARWTRQGPYITLRMKFGQDVLSGIARRMRGRR